jgi:hypothetical protein
MTLRNRLAKIERALGAHDKHGYLCVTGPDSLAADEEAEKGYKIQPLVKSAGGTGEAPFHLATWEEVEAFAARPDVELTILTIVFEDRRTE